jgi:hypothetical protein
MTYLTKSTGRLLGRFLVATAVAASALGCSEFGSEVGTNDAGAGVDALDARRDVEPQVVRPRLSALSVSTTTDADGSASMELVPPFSSQVFDYYVRCVAGKNVLTVSMTAPPGTSSALVLPTTSRSSPKQTVSLSVEENQAIVATATAGSATTEYWVRCLPHDFPQLLMQAYPEVAVPLPGYYLVGNSGTTPGYAMVLDGNGVPIWYFRNSTAGVDDVDNVVSGAASFFLTWTVAPVSVQYLSPWMAIHAAPSGITLDPHELRVLPNGHYLALSYPLATVSRTVMEGIEVADAGGNGAQMFDCEIVEFDPKTGTVAWTWVASEHFDPSVDSVAATIATYDLGVEALDPFHCNSIDVDPANGNLLVSSRNMNSVFYIDRSTGKVVWKMGGSS